MGGESAYLAKSRGIAGSIIDGFCTGVPKIQEVDYPVWSRGGTTITGHHRLETVEINGTISCAGVQVKPGDLIVADNSGVTVIPPHLIQEVLHLMEQTYERMKETRELVNNRVNPAEIGNELTKAR